MQRTIRLSLELATVCGALALAPLSGCDAPDKNVGQETEGASETEGTSSGGVSSLTPGESDSNSSQTSTDPSESGPETDSDSDSETDSDSDGPQGCEAQSNQSDCEAMNCGWADVREVTTDDDTCAFADGESFCFSYPDDADCVDTPACGEAAGYWYQETGAGAWNIIEVPGCDIIPGYQPCTYDGESPAGCDCACDETPSAAPLPEGWEDTISPAGCSDISIYAANASNTLMLSASLNEGIAAAASKSQETFQGDFDVSEFWTLSVLVGENVSINQCNDAPLPGKQTDQEWLAQSGTVSVTLVPDADTGGEAYGRATMVFNDVVLGYAGSTYTIDGLTLADVAVGWFPG